MSFRPDDRKMWKNQGLTEDEFRDSIPRTEEVFVCSEDLRQTLSDCFANDDGLKAYQRPDFIFDGLFRAPYIMYYHFRHLFSQSSDSLRSGILKDQCNKLISYLDSCTSTQKARADKMFKAGKVTAEYIPYLFKPGQLLLQQSEHGLRAVKQKSIVREAQTSQQPVKRRDAGNAKLRRSWDLDVEIVSFDGKFSVGIELESFTFPSISDPVDIKDLKVYPLEFADPCTRRTLLERGRLFWGCRNGRYMAGPSNSDKSKQDVRYMIDAKTYNLLHPRSLPNVRVDLAEGNEDDEDFLLRMPASVQAYNMQEKRWLTLPVDSLKDVAWNTDAFESLAVDDKTKLLIKALVTNKIHADEGTDVVAGKGTGLIVLLHGGPGTGKTLTAESVAEFARKPLYRITCGDIGTTPKEVEVYLEAVFQLGRTWDCVVLLDEADVFLEQRSFANLERNALVSVFLRVLEYYDGILLLTSNRVGTFDEAFKSRIQLALHYDNLVPRQRCQIWTNFFDRLEALKVDANFVEIRGKLETLANNDLNGRQIRNVITTARQLAKHQGEKLNYAHLNHVIGVSGKFEKYLLDVQDQVTDAERQRDAGIR